MKKSHTHATLKKLPVIGYFWEKSFFHYLWTGGFFTIANVALLWVFIDVLHISTVLSGLIVTGGLFIIRYLFYRWFRVM